MAARERPKIGVRMNPPVRSVDWDTELEMVRPLFVKYRQWLADHADPAPESRRRVAQGLALIDRLISALPGPYGGPRGDVLLWLANGRPVACGALREIETGVGEIKRISVEPSYRGKEFGTLFVRALVNRANALGFEKLRVDTLASMSAAIEFYQEAGFRPVTAFWPHPAAGALFFERNLP